MALSSSSRRPKCLGWFFLRILVRGFARGAKFGANSHDTLLKCRNERSSVCVIGCSSFLDSVCGVLCELKKAVKTNDVT